MNIDRHSETWAEIASYAKTQIENNRARLEQVGLPQSDADVLRGANMALRGLLKLVEPSKIPALSSHET